MQGTVFFARGEYLRQTGLWEKTLGLVCFSQFKYFIRVYIAVFMFWYFNDYVFVLHIQRNYTMSKVVANSQFDWHNYNESESKYLMQSRFVELDNTYGLLRLQIYYYQYRV